MTEKLLLNKKLRLLKSLADMTRLKIIELLRHGEKCQCDIIPHLNKSQSTISQHLRELTDSKILLCRREGQRIIYWISDERILEILDLLDSIVIDSMTEELELLEKIKMKSK